LGIAPTPTIRMALSLVAGVSSFSGSMVRSAPACRAHVTMETAADLQALAQKCNPTVGFYDPLGLVAKAKDDNTEQATLGWYRHAEIKHGRVAMAAFVGFIVQSNGICFPWALTGGGSPIMHSDILAAGGPGDQWDALPTAAKLQILGFIGLLELVSETTVFLNQAGEKHYVKGGKPGFFPPFSAIGLPHPVPLNLWDPFGFTKKMSAERKEKALVAEINNGRLAQIGIFGFLSASKGLVVPGMDSIEGIKPYAGEYMAAFSATDDLPYVQAMLDYAPKFGNLVPTLY